MGKSIALFLLVGFILALTFLSLFSFGALETLGSEYDDKLNHFIAHTVLTLIAFNYFRYTSVNKILLSAVLLSVTYGIIIELIQLTIATSRTFDLLDLAANFLGALFATILLKIKEYVKIN